MNRFMFLIFVFLLGTVYGQKSSDIQRVLSFQEKINEEFASKETTPLTAQDFQNFKALDFFKIDTSFCLKAKFVRTPHETPFIMQTTTGREPLYVKYGEAHFRLQEKKIVLNIYQNQGLINQPEYKDYLFLPFTDLTNGTSTYSGGRFIDLKIPDGDMILIDFNTAYNPYCAYNERYSCPIPPEENHLDLPVRVGVKKYKNTPDHK